MEFKSRIVRKRKQAQAKRRKESGMKRVKVRGRKRWIRAEKSRS